jgi:hypothetical protein
LVNRKRAVLTFIYQFFQAFSANQAQCASILGMNP